VPGATGAGLPAFLALASGCSARSKRATGAELTVLVCKSTNLALNGIRLLPRGNPVPRNGRTGPNSDSGVPLQPIEQRSRRRPGPPEQTQLTTPHQERPKATEADLATLALTIRYKGEERTTKLALTHRAIRQLALEAGLRDRRIGEFISELVIATIFRDAG
jgi:hypothetical protein